MAANIYCITKFQDVHRKRTVDSKRCLMSVVLDRIQEMSSDLDCSSSSSQHSKSTENLAHYRTCGPLFFQCTEDQHLWPFTRLAANQFFRKLPLQSAVLNMMALHMAKYPSQLIRCLPSQNYLDSASLRVPAATHITSKSVVLLI